MYITDYLHRNSLFDKFYGQSVFETSDCEPLAVFRSQNKPQTDNVDCY